MEMSHCDCIKTANKAASHDVRPVCMEYHLSGPIGVAIVLAHTCMVGEIAPKGETNITLE